MIDLPNPNADAVWWIAWSSSIALPNGQRMIIERTEVLIFTRMFFDAREIACVDLARERCDVTVMLYDPEAWPDAFYPAPSGRAAQVNDVINPSRGKRKNGRPIQVRQVQKHIRTKRKTRKDSARSNRSRHAPARKLSR